MTDSPPPYIADFDSATAMLRATAAMLRGEDFPALGLSPAMKPLAKSVNLLPQSARETVYALGGWWEAVPPSRAGEVSAEAVARWMVEEYPERRYPAVAIGSSCGALVHLYAALRIPMLPQTFLVPIRQKVHPDEPKDALEMGRAPAEALLRANPEVRLHHMHDPNQDRLMVRYMTYFRLKHLALPAAYRDFIERCLEPGGTIFVVACGKDWPTTTVGERHLFQHGAVGGATEEEFFEGGERVAEYLARYGSHRRAWDPPQPDGRSPEAEWGFAEEIVADLAELAERKGHRLVRIAYEEPDTPSPLMADLHRWWYERRGLRPNRLLVESFIMLEPWWALRTGSVPYWMTFNKEPSAAALESFLDAREPFDEINLMLFAHGTEGVGLPDMQRWRGLLDRARQRGRFIGVDEEAHPQDFASFARYHEELQKLPARYPMPGPLHLDDLWRFLAEAGDRYPVRWEIERET
jgi:hypothetical protein